MKKLLSVFVIACAAISLNAATVDWSVNLGWVTQADTDADTTLAGYVGYLFDAGVYTQSALQTALTTSGNSVLSSALGHGSVTADGELAFSGSGLSYDDSASPAWAKALMVIIDSSASEGSAFTFASFADVKVTDAVIAGGAKFGDGGDIYTGSTATWSTVATPEPTSGLLMLLGMAGLALRRRRA